MGPVLRRSNISEIWVRAPLCCRGRHSFTWRTVERQRRAVTTKQKQRKKPKAHASLSRTVKMQKWGDGARTVPQKVKYVIYIKVEIIYSYLCKVCCHQVTFFCCLSRRFCFVISMPISHLAIQQQFLLGLYAAKHTLRVLSKTIKK